MHLFPTAMLRVLFASQSMLPRMAHGGVRAALWAVVGAGKRRGAACLQALAAAVLVRMQPPGSAASTPGSAVPMMISPAATDEPGCVLRCRPGPG